jgi:L-threonylcarbamoyladenylate synthase
MMRIDATTERDRALTAGAAALRRGELIVLPTEHVYGLAADAFHRKGTAALRRAKGYDAHMALPVFVSSVQMVSGVAQPDARAEALMEAFWPGPLTVILSSQSTLNWDTATGGSVAVRMPLHPLALILVQRTGPLAVTSANPAGMDPPTDAAMAQAVLGDHVSVVVDAGPVMDGGEPSTVIDLSAPVPTIVREGAVTPDQLAAFLPDLRVG